MNRRFRAGEMTLGEVYDNLSPFRPHVDNFQASVDAADESGRDLLPPPARSDSPSLGELQRRAHDAIHTYLSHVARYDTNLTQPAYYKVASTLEAIAQPLGRRARAQQGTNRENGAS